MAVSNDITHTVTVKAIDALIYEPCSVIIVIHVINLAVTIHSKLKGNSDVQYNTDQHYYR